MKRIASFQEMYVLAQPRVSLASIGGATEGFLSAFSSNPSLSEHNVLQDMEGPWTRMCPPSVAGGGKACRIQVTGGPGVGQLPFR